jgi:tRNA (cytidine/uridine-2'-O-)-methyltransferase
VFHVVLVNPEIPPNTGNVIRLCANTGTKLHLIEPLGFTLSAAKLRRAGMDYTELASVTVHPDWAACRAALGEARLFALTTKANRRTASADYQPGDAFVFGSESGGNTCRY